MRLLCYSRRVIICVFGTNFNLKFIESQIVLSRCTINSSRISVIDIRDRYRIFDLVKASGAINLVLWFEQVPCLFEYKTLILLSFRSQRTTSVAQIPRELIPILTQIR